jgi:predicted phosphodiesterase/hypothetical membrane protein
MTVRTAGDARDPRIQLQVMTDDSHPFPGHPRAALLSSVAAAVSLIGGWTLAQSLQQPDFDPLGESISALAAIATPNRWVMTVALVLTGVMHLVTAWGLPGMRWQGRAALAGAGAATLAVAAVPLPARGQGSALHTAVAAVAFLLLAVWPWFGSHERAQGLLRPVVARRASAVLLVAVASLAVTLVLPAGVFGLHERLVAGALVLWPAVTAAVAWWLAGWPIGAPHSKHVLSTVAFTAIALVGGIAATNLAPVTAQTQFYQASVSLSPDPREATDILVPTVFGDITLNFRGLAPGIVATPQIRAEITDALARPGMSASSLQPSSEELERAVRDAAIQVGIRFLVGAALTMVLLLIGYVLVRHRRPRRWLVASATTAALAATTATAVAMQRTYRVDREPTFATTGVLTAVQSNLGIFGDVEERSAQVAPYLRNLIVLSEALQEKYTETSLDREVALRVLLVSDIHASNLYPLMRSIVEEEDIDLVIDAGDIVNFGSAAELDASDIREGIASLEVPYVFVRGNHDARSELDYGVVDAIASVPNAFVLQPSPDRFTELEIGGLRIAGFNDPRWFGDTGSGSAQKQQPARERFVAAFEGRDPVDLLVSHEPWAVLDVPDVGVAVHGHMHSQALEGNRIQAGTFTGGGPFAHFAEQAPGEELTGQPFAFDVLAFDADCRLATLTRYQYRNLIRGRPAYDDISLVNGSRVDTRPVDEEDPRECRPPTRITQRTVEAVDAEEGEQEASRQGDSEQEDAQQGGTQETTTP